MENGGQWSGRADQREAEGRGQREALRMPEASDAQAGLAARVSGQGLAARKFCPMTEGDCDENCAWRLGNACAAAVLGREAYAAVEAYMLVNRLEKVDEKDSGQ